MSAPVDLTPEQADDFLVSRLKQDNLRRIARDRRNDLSFNWRKLSYFIANEKRLAPPGLYAGPGLNGKQAWSGAHVASILHWGKNPIFDNDETAPQWIISEVQAGIADAARKTGRVRLIGRDFANALGVNAADRERLKVWLVGAIDRTDDAGLPPEMPIIVIATMIRAWTTSADPPSDANMRRPQRSTAERTLNPARSRKSRNQCLTSAIKELFRGQTIFPMRSVTSQTFMSAV